MDKRIKLYLIVLVGMLVVGFGSSALTSVGISDSMFPAIPYLGALPFLGAAVFTVYWWFWGKKQVS